MQGITEKVTFPIPLDMEGKGCVLFDIRGKVKPFTNEPLFLCANFIKSSMVGSNKQMPILRKINLLKMNRREEELEILCIIKFYGYQPIVAL